MASTEERDTKELNSAFAQPIGRFGGGAIDPAANFYKGTIACFDTSDQLIKPGAASTTLIALGRCESTKLAGDDRPLRIRSGAFGYNSGTAGDAITNANAGTDVYIMDNDTVGLTDGGGARSVAGKVELVDGDVFVVFNPLV